NRIVGEVKKFNLSTQNTVLVDAIGNITQDDRVDVLSAKVNLRDGGLDRKLLAVGAQSEDGSQAPITSARSPKAAHVLDDLGSKALGNEAFDRRSHCLARRAAKDMLSGS